MEHHIAQLNCSLLQLASGMYYPQTTIHMLSTCFPQERQQAKALRWQLHRGQLQKSKQEELNHALWLTPKIFTLHH